jgi:Fe2+ transport system protein FeoA
MSVAMNKKEITCSMCGTSFIPAARGGCQSCPMNNGCSLVCCPKCGYENVDVQQSSLARLASRFLRRASHSPHPGPLPRGEGEHASPALHHLGEGEHTSPPLHHLREGERASPALLRLSEVPPGRRTRVVDFLPGLPADRRAQLQAYGLAPGYYIRVVQHSPVTIIQVDHTELALEASLARQVQVGD